MGRLDVDEILGQSCVAMAVGGMKSTIEHNMTGMGQAASGNSLEWEWESDITLIL